MKTIFLYISIFLSFFLLSCEQGENEPSIIKKDPTTFSLNILPTINNSKLELGKFYNIVDTDSILITRCDFYISQIAINDTLNIDSVFINRFSNSSNKISFSVPSNISNITKIKMFDGLSESNNNQNPTSFPNDHSLSSNQNMYWNSWTKYRYVVLEGEFKITSPTPKRIPFAYHTGLTFQNSVDLSLNKNIEIEKDNVIDLVLDIKKIFYTTIQNTIDYNDPKEVQSHSNPNETIITNKFATNFIKAFSVKK